MTLDLQTAAKTAFAYARDQKAKGAIPIYLGLPGMLALMHRDIQEYSQDPDVDKLLSLAAHAVCALAVSMEEEEEEEDDVEDIDGYDVMEVHDETPEGQAILSEMADPQELEDAAGATPPSTIIADDGRWSEKKD